MIKFLLHIFESGICLTILCGVYLLFFRKETFFRFNRIYLISIMFFSLLIPLVHISFNVKDIAGMESSLTEIVKFRTYYSKLIAMTDPEFHFEEQRDAFEEAFGNSGIPSLNSKGDRELQPGGQVPASEMSSSSFNGQRTIPWHLIILGVYLAGFSLFFFRLVGLFIWLVKIIRTNKYIRQGKFRIVQLKEEMPPFSFFGYIFVNKEIHSKNDFEKILAHEKIHIRQFHSLDLILAHCLSIFQWFNPIAWKLQEAIKTNHEYLADKHVVNQGFELFDYQSLLLTQLISIRSVELVNNFNVLSIQKRIAMMTKIKSGLTAKLKVILIVPFALALFFLFANLTVKGPNASISNFISVKSENEMLKFQGIWENTGSGDDAQLVAFGSEIFSILKDQTVLDEFKATMDKEHILIKMWGGMTSLSYEFKNNELIIWWSESTSASYRKIDSDNSLDYFIGSMGKEIELPALNEYQLIKGSNSFSLVFMKGKLSIEGQEGSLSDLDKLLTKQKAKVNILDLPKLTVMLYIDSETKMEEMDQIFLALRQHNFLKTVYVGQPQDENSSVLLAHVYGRPYKLPPMDAEILPEIEIEKSGVKLHKMYCEKPVAAEKVKLKSFISSAEKYITPLYYTDETNYASFISYIDMVFGVVFEFRNQFAEASFNSEYSNLSGDQQKKVRKRYPLTIFCQNTDGEVFGSK